MFKIQILSKDFKGKSLVQQHRLVQDFLKDEIQVNLIFHWIFLLKKVNLEYAWNYFEYKSNWLINIYNQRKEYINAI